MQYKNPIFKRLIPAIIFWIIIAVFYFFGVDLLFYIKEDINTNMAEVIKNNIKIVNLVFGALWVIAGYFTAGLFQIKTIDDYLESKGITELTSIKGIIEGLIIRQQKIKQIELAECEGMSKKRYAGDGK